jgi:hypothetical protein
MQDSLLEFASRTKNQIEILRKENEQFNAITKNDLQNLQKQIDMQINDCNKNTSNELTYTNKFFNKQLAESENKLLDQNNHLLNILIEISNKNNFQFESVKECCIVQSNNMKSIIQTLQKIINSSFYDLENSNKQSLEVIGNSLTRLSEKIDLDSKMHKESQENSASNSSSEKSFKIIKNYYDEQRSITFDEKFKIMESKLNMILFHLNIKEKNNEESP